jgi:hypothetical protein
VFSWVHDTDGQDFSVFYVYGTIVGLRRIRCRGEQGLRFLVMMSAVVLSSVFGRSIAWVNGSFERERTGAL